MDVFFCHHIVLRFATVSLIIYSYNETKMHISCTNFGNSKYTYIIADFDVVRMRYPQLLNLWEIKRSKHALSSALKARKLLSRNTIRRETNVQLNVYLKRLFCLHWFYFENPYKSRVFARCFFLGRKKNEYYGCGTKIIHQSSNIPNEFFFCYRTYITSVKIDMYTVLGGKYFFQ